MPSDAYPRQARSIPLLHGFTGYMIQKSRPWVIINPIYFTQEVPVHFVKKIL